MHKRIRKLTTLLLSGAMAAGTVAGGSLPMLTGYVVSAEESTKTLFDISFDNGSTEGFAIYMEGGDSSLSNRNGEMEVTIRKCGTLNYANQIYWDGFELLQGCDYILSFDIHGDLARKVDYRIQMNGGNYRGYVDRSVDVKEEAQHVEVQFTMGADTDPAPRLCFNMGKYNGMDEEPGEHHIYLDNVKLTLLNAGAVQETEPEPLPTLVSVNQVGYRPGDEKIAVATAEAAGAEFNIVNENGEVVYTGMFDVAFGDKATQRDVCHGDFSDLTEDGTYTIMVGDDIQSEPFSIGEAVYEQLFKDTFKMMYLQRCGVELTEEYAGIYAHPACHTTEATVYGTDEKKEVNGGWHDAGDFGRYSVTAAKTAADLLLAYEANMDDPLIASDDLGLPESGNGIPDILDEVRFELDWFLKMQDEATGGVYHKVSCYNFPGTVMPQNETNELVLAPIAATSTADFAAIMAKAAVDYAEIDAAFSETCLDAAMKAWDYLQNNPHKGFTNPPEISTGEYGDGSAKDEIYWAAVELYLAGQALGRETIDADAIPSETSPELGWVEIGGYGLYDLATAEVSGDKIEKHAEAAKKKLLDKANDLKKLSESDGYFVTLGTWGYYWGSNMGVANNGMLLLFAEKLTGDASYRTTAEKQLDYLLGVNGMAFSHVSGFGSNSMKDPHHRPSQYMQQAVPGMLSGGPNAGREDPYAAQVLKGVKAPALCYVDNQQSYSTNEVAIYWNSPLVYLIAGI
ncbi:MAG: glycoside hydrolase family 9 protein [Clostridiales bacterium]|nr:glycoside hydrolase family 9 protein [Candidatus Blautia equi]